MGRIIHTQDLPPLPGFVSTADIAREMRKTHGAVNRWIWDGRLPAYSIGGVVVVADSDYALFKTLRTELFGSLPTREEFAEAAAKRDAGQISGGTE